MRVCHFKNIATSPSKRVMLRGLGRHRHDRMGLAAIDTSFRVIIVQVPVWILVLIQRRSIHVHQGNITEGGDILEEAYTHSG